MYKKNWNCENVIFVLGCAVSFGRGSVATSPSPRARGRGICEQTPPPCVTDKGAGAGLLQSDGYLTNYVDIYICIRNTNTRNRFRMESSAVGISLVAMTTRTLTQRTRTCSLTSSSLLDYVINVIISQTARVTVNERYYGTHIHGNRC